MYQYYTDQTLLRYIYGECTSEECKCLKDRASEDVVLMERINQFRHVHEMLNSVHHLPSQTSVDIIMEYSKNVEEQLEASC